MSDEGINGDWDKTNVLLYYKLESKKAI
jgi:hypothetical protein